MGPLTAATLLRGAAMFATTAGPRGTWYVVPQETFWATTGVVERVIWAGLWIVMLAEPWGCA